MTKGVAPKTWTPFVHPVDGTTRSYAPPNQAPAWTGAITGSFQVGTASFITLAAYAVDPEGDAITYTWEVAPPSGSGLSLDNATGRMTWSGSGPAATLTGLRIRATATGGFSVSAPFTITISAAPAASTSDWIARSTGPGVVWAHNFDTAAEVDAFRWQGGIGNVPVLANSDGNTRWVSNDGFAGGGCLEINIPGGGLSAAGWIRPFSPLLAGGNGKAANDPGDGGSITRRAWNPNNNGQAEAWVNGFYANPADFASQGGASAFDGSEFYIQFRVKISGNRANPANPPGKLAFIARTRYTPNNEIVIQSLTNPRYSMYTNFGSRSNSFLFEPQDGGSGPHSSLQPGSEFAAPPTYWTWPLDEWVTVQVRVTCGRHSPGDSPNMSTGFRETGITVWVARAGATSYTKIWDKQNYVITYGSGSDILPWGWNAFIPSGFMNSVPAAAGAGWTHRFTQIIFSRQFIPCPDPAPTWFLSMPDRTWATPVTNTLDSVKPSPLPPGSHAAICTAWTGGFVDPDRKEFGLCANGGHGDYGGNETYVVKLNVAAPAWQRLNTPSVASGGGTFNAKNDYADGKMRSVHGWHRCTFGEGKVWYAGMDGIFSSGLQSSACWSFDRSTLTWEYLGLGIPNPGGGNLNTEAGAAVYDPVSRKVWSTATGGNAAGQGVWSVDVQTKAIVQYPITFGSGNPRWGAAGLGFVFFGDTSNGRIGVIDTSNPGAGITFRTPTGGAFPPDKSGCVFHAPSRALLLWHANGSSIIKIAIPANPLTGVYTISTIAAAPSNTVTPTGAQPNGTYSRFNLVPDMGNGQSALVIVNSTTGATFVYKLPAAGV
jgi:hypothetical protein